MKLVDFLNVKIFDSEKEKMVENFLQTIFEKELTARQKEILFKRLKGKNQSQIAAEENISKSTISRHITKSVNILNKHLNYARVFFE